ncbi:SpoIIE family protein phosphatase [Actinomadura gamaensis]|uniref:SpoIIE family protein phosphatase n=1 Tax=Actinomadura gamaensis TaxID=1763541 RepID=A0ABV9UDF0_9ACTN
MRLPRLSDGGDLEHIAGQLRLLGRAQQRMEGLLSAVMAISGELELPVALRQIVTTAMELVDARYGAMGVLDEHGDGLSEFIPVGLDEAEISALAGVDLPHGRGLLGELIRRPEPLRVSEIGRHPRSVGFPPGHPPMRTLLGVAISVRGRIYGNLYLADRRDGRPFDDDDEAVVLALAGAAGVTVENARLYQQVRAGAERFQRLLLPRLPDLAPFTAAAVYRPAAADERGLVGGDWYDALLLPDRSCAAVIGDVVGHDLTAAAAMAQTRNMLRALLYDRGTPPSSVLTQLDHTLHAITDNPVTTACLARIEPVTDPPSTGRAEEPDSRELRWRLHWSNAGHPPPLLVSPEGKARYLDAEPGVPLGVETALPRPDHTCLLPAGATVVMFTDGLVEHRRHPIEEGFAALAATAAAHADRSLPDLCRALVDHQPGDGHDDLAVLLLRTPDVT